MRNKYGLVPTRPPVLVCRPVSVALQPEAFRARAQPTGASCPGCGHGTDSRSRGSKGHPGPCYLSWSDSTTGRPRYFLQPEPAGPWEESDRRRAGERSRLQRGRTERRGRASPGLDRRTPQAHRNHLGPVSEDPPGPWRTDDESVQALLELLVVHELVDSARQGFGEQAFDPRWRKPDILAFHRTVENEFAEDPFFGSAGR